MRDAVILNFDNSVGSLPGTDAIPLNEWQEIIRYGCSLRDLDRLEGALDRQGLDLPRITFLGSGDFHHLSYLLIRRLESEGPLQAVVFDNHPDNMRYPFGIHCGSWVHHVCKLPFVSKVTVIGISSGDIRGFHLLENYLLPLFRGKLSYLCLTSPPGLARALGLKIDRFEEDSRALPAWIETHLLGRDPIYLSIDKDVLSSDVVRTNWDQGRLTKDALIGSIRALAPSLLAADVTGEISFHPYRSSWKKILSRWDGQASSPPPSLDALQTEHRDLNRRILSALLEKPAGRPPRASPE